MKQMVIKSRWGRFLLLTFFLVIMPYRFGRTPDGSIEVLSIFYAIFTAVRPYVFLNSFSPIALVNMMMIIIPSAYFTYRVVIRTEGESLFLEGVILIGLTLALTSVLMPSELTTAGQIDTGMFAVENFPFMPSFAMLLSVTQILIPLLKIEADFNTPTISMASESFSQKKNTLFSITSGRLLLALFVFPSVVQIDSHIRISALAAFYSFQYSPASLISSESFMFTIGGIRFLPLMLTTSVWSFLFVLASFLYVQERYRKSFVVTLGLVSLIPLLFLTFATLALAVFYWTGYIFLFVPILQIACIVVIRRSKKIKAEPNVTGVYIEPSRHVTVPFRYMVMSFFRKWGNKTPRFEFDEQTDESDVH